jgi:hypothetical protein
MKDKILDLMMMGTKGDPMNLVKSHNQIIAILADIPEEYLPSEIFALRNQMQDLIDKNNLNLNG